MEHKPVSSRGAILKCDSSQPVQQPVLHTVDNDGPGAGLHKGHGFKSGILVTSEILEGERKEFGAMHMNRESGSTSCDLGKHTIPR